MTAAELRAIVCDVPSEALGDVRWTTDPENALFFVRGVAGFIPVHVAEHAFIGSMTAWLAAKKKYPTAVIHKDNAMFKDGAMVGVNDRQLSYVASSLVAALAAACKEAA